MKHRPFYVVAVLAAAAAMALTVYFSGGGAGGKPAEDEPPPSRKSNRGQAVRSGPVVFVPELITNQEQVTHPRIVALAPGVAQIVRDLHMGRLLVGRHSSDDWSDPRLPICGDQSGIDYEKLIALEPTHVYLQWGENPLPERLVALQREKGWIVRNVPLLHLTDINNAVIIVYDNTRRQEADALQWERAHTAPNPDPLTGKPGPARQQSEAERLVANAPYTLLHGFEKAMEADDALAGAGRILLLYQGEGENGKAPSPAALGPGSYHHDILLRLGGRTATEKGKPFIPLDAEDVSSLKPDGIIIVRPRSARAAADANPDPQSIDALMSTLGVIARLDIPAAKNKRVALIDDPMALIPGTNMSKIADRMREILKGWSGPAPVQSK
jgi:ABC-type hemin transport system substrate-binding protein